VAWFLLLLAAGPAAVALEPVELLSRIRSPTLAPDGAVSLRNVELDMGPAIFEVQRGILFPGEPIAGRTVELVFIGQARFHLDAPDPIEAGQLELFTGERSLEAPVEEAVLVLANQEAVAELLRRPPPREIRGELLERAEGIHRRWLDRAERRGAGIESAIFKLLVGDQAFQQYFALWCHSFELGDFVYQLDPEEQEQVTLASFRPLELTNWERMRLRHELRVQQRKGRWLDLRVQDLGSWDVWLSTAWKPSMGPPLPGNVGFESEHYELDVKLERRSLELRGRARLSLTAESDGRRIVRLELMRDLAVSDVEDGRGRDLFFFRSGDEIAVLLPEPSTAGERLTLDVTYGGRALEWVRGKTHNLKDTSLWYPHCGTVDRATYDVTLRWPKKYDVVASGRLEESGREGRYLWERRRLDLPGIAFSFAVGSFIVEHERSGDTDITLAFGRETRARNEPQLRAQMLETVSNALAFYESAFGEYPLDEITLVTVPRDFSQSYPGFVTLADSMVKYPNPLGASATWTRNTTIAHELAHQWWGNKVGWWSYRDQWLSEGMANYSALLYDSKVTGEDDRLAVMSAGWRNSLSKTTIEGRTIESLGPIVLGSRLNSTRARNGYRTIVYRKGAVVLAMLARAVGEDQFLQMLRSLADAAQHRVVTTEMFIKALERMSGRDLEGFSRQYVYGTGIPEVYYGYDLQPIESGGWAVQGEARLLFTPHYRYDIVHAESGWDVLRRQWPQSDAGPTTMMVPYQVTLEGEPVRSATRRGRPTRPRQTGQVVLEGRRDGFRIETDRRPVDVRLDPRGELLAWFYSAQGHPKRFLHYEAEDLAAAGELAAAESRYLEALASPAEAATRDPLASGSDGEGIQGRVQDVKIRLALTRVYLDQGRLDEAEQALDAIDGELETWDRMMFRMQRDALRSRLEILNGDFEPAYKRLKKTLRLASPRRVRVPWRNLMLQLQLNTERAAVTEAYSLLAIAAHETGNRNVFRWALSEARDRRVDVSALEPFEAATAPHDGALDRAQR
jgi:hypothetical protein